MEIRLHELTLKNFKSVKHFTLKTDGQNVKIIGDNETGKTTLADSWNWLLFNKDSNDRADFEVKTLDENNEAIHNLEHEVYSKISIDKKPLELKKVLKEKWQRKRGAATETFTGHATDYYFRDMEADVKMTKYEDQLYDIIDEKLFKLLTNPTYFNEVLHWQERQRILFELIDDVTDEEVINSDNRFQVLKEALETRSLEKHKSNIKSKQNKINKKLDEIPIRIDEIDNGLPDIEGLNKEEIEAKINVLKKKKKKKEKELSRLEAGGEVAEKRKKIAEIDVELMEIKNNYSGKYTDDIDKLNNEKSDINNEINEAQMEVKKIEREIADNKETVVKLKNSNDKLRDQFKRLAKEKTDLLEQEFDESIFDRVTCPECGHEFPLEDLESHRSRFNKQKAESIEEKTLKQKDINKQGKNNKNKIQELIKENGELAEKLSKYTEYIENLKENIKDKDAEIDNLKEKANAYEEDFEYKKLTTEKNAVKEKLDKLQQDKQQSIEDLEKEIEEFEKEITIDDRKLNDIEEHVKGLNRIAELEKKQKMLVKEHEELQKEYHICEEFVRAKSRMIESKINSKFKIAKFKLFEEQINGGINDQICETIVEGVPYTTNLNTGARINVGLDIINTLSEHYNFYAPIFIDNAESVSYPIETKSQTIKLIKPSTYEELDEDIREALIEKHGSAENAKEKWKKKYSKLNVIVDEPDIAKREVS